jgi:hypothetical protein
MDSAPQASFHGVVDSACGNAREHMKYTWTSFSLLFGCADHFSFCLPVTSLTNLRDSAATPRSQEMSQDAPGTPTIFVMAATLTSKADLKAWYRANNPTLRSHGLSCPKALYKEMKRDLRGRFRTMVAIVFYSVTSTTRITNGQSVSAIHVLFKLSVLFYEWAHGCHSASVASCLVKVFFCGPSAGS